MTLYVEDRFFQALAERCAADMPPCPWTGGLDVNGAKIAIAERLNVWPATIRADAESMAAYEAMPDTH